MVVNFRARGISRGARKLTRISTLIIIIKKNSSNISSSLQFYTKHYSIIFFNYTLIEKKNNIVKSTLIVRVFIFGFAIGLIINNG